MKRIAKFHKVSEAQFVKDWTETFGMQDKEELKDIYEAGGGIVAKSNEDYELQEVNNKLGALHRAITMAENM